MNYNLIKDVLGLVEDFEKNLKGSNGGIEAFKNWIVINNKSESVDNEPHWEGKENGRSAESVISTLIVHLNRYSKNYSKSAIFGSDFSTQEDFIYLINLKAFGEMTKMDLIKKNVHEKPTGMQVINRLIGQGWVNQTDSQIDKRSKFLKINDYGLAVLEKQMDQIRKASDIISGDLSRAEKLDLIRLLNKLNDFHQPIYDKNIESEYLLSEVLKHKN